MEWAVVIIFVMAAGWWAAARAKDRADFELDIVRHQLELARSKQAVFEDLYIEQLERLVPGERLVHIRNAHEDAKKHALGDLSPDGSDSERQRVYRECFAAHLHR